MSEEEGPGIKQKIFLAAILVFLVFMIGFYAYNFINVNNKYISEESDAQTSCVYKSFDLIKTNYSSNKLTLLIKNPVSSDSKISTISIKAGNETITKSADINLQMQKEIIFDNLNLQESSIKIYIDNCEAYAKTITVTET